MRHGLVLLLVAGLGGCATSPTPDVPLSPVQPNLSTQATEPANNPIGAVAGPTLQSSYGTAAALTLPAQAAGGGGDISLNFADTDIRTVVAQILGQILQVNYTIDPAVHGSAIFHSSTPLTNAQLLPVLQALLAENGATLQQSGTLYSVVPSAAGTDGPAALTNGSASGGVVVPLRYADAAALAGMLQPFVGPGGKIAAVPAGNAVIIAGDSATRQTLVDLVSTFDVDMLAGQSYTLLPVDNGSAKNIAESLQTAIAGKSTSADVRIVALDRVNAILVVAAKPDEIADVRRVFGLITSSQLQQQRSWNVYYLQASQADNLAYVLQQAFTPDNVTAVPDETKSGYAAAGTPSLGTAIGSSGAIGSQGSIGAGTGIGGGGNSLGAAETPAGLGATTADTESDTAAPPSAANPLLGGLGGGGGENGGGDTDEMRIIPDSQNNALLIYATQSEDNLVNAMLAKIDVLPLEVRIDAVIAEVDLDNALQYGTQFFFKSGGINGILNNAATTLTNPSAVALDAAFPGFILSGNGAGGAPIAISALNAVTQVQVLSSPQLLVLNNMTAQLQVGSLVPYLTQTSQSTLTVGSPVINSVQYQPTGVIMQVTPRVDRDGLIMLSISQNVSSVDTSATTSTGIQSPTFLQRSITSSVVVQDGQTVGLAGLISDNSSRTNSGIPWLKDVPVLGFLAGTQNNKRTRTEMLVLLTPYVVYNQQDARALLQDLQNQLPNAAAVPFDLQRPPEGLADPNLPYRPVTP